MRGISPVVFGPGGGGIEPKMLNALLITLVSVTLLFILLLIERVKVENLKYQINKLIYMEKN